MSKETTLRAAKLAGLLARHYSDAPIDQIVGLVALMQRASRAASI